MDTNKKRRIQGGVLDDMAQAVENVAAVMGFSPKLGWTHYRVLMNVEYRPCSRNPLIAQTLATLDKMEQRGSGFARMRDAMLDHGLNEAKIDQQDGFFIVTLPGPDGNYDHGKAGSAPDMRH